MPKQPIDFLAPWRSVPTIWLDFETTGVTPLVDAAVEVALVRFQNGKPVGELSALVNPGRPIPKEASDIHGITDDDVRDAPSLVDVFDGERARDLLAGAQPAAYNAPFDRLFVPPGVLPHDWPWLDAMVLAKICEPYAKGKGRYKLSTVCERHGMTLIDAHSAAVDSMAAGKLFYTQATGQFADSKTMGDVLARLEVERVKDWHRFHTWLAEQPPLEESV